MMNESDNRKFVEFVNKAVTLEEFKIENKNKSSLIYSGARGTSITSTNINRFTSRYSLPDKRIL